MSTGGEERVDYSLVQVGTLTLKDTNETPGYISIVICQNKIIVVDYNDYKVKIHRLHDGKFLDMLDSDSKPRAICLMDATTICVLHLDGLIEMVSIKSEDMSPVFTRMKSFRLDGVFDYYHSVVRVNDNIVVVGVKQDTTYWCITSLDDGHVDTIHRICKESLWSYVTTKDNIIYISCYAGVANDDTGVYAFDILNPSQCKYKYKHQRLQRPTSIVINEDGNIFVCNGFRAYPWIHQLTASCQLVAIFTQEIPLRLQVMFWDDGRLYVTRFWSHDITVFRHVYQEGSHKYSEFPLSHETKQPIIVETSKEIEQGNADKRQSNVKMAAPPSGQSPKDSENGKQDQNPEKDASFIECIKESNLMKIELLLKTRMVPSKSTIIHAIKEHGYNKGIQCLLREMSNLLRKQISNAIRVWSGYRTEDVNTPVFVVIFRKETIIPEKMKFLEPYDDYEIVFRKEHTPNNEEKIISKLSPKKENANTTDEERMARVRAEEERMAPVLDCIAKNTKQLMNEHSNLSIIAASTVKSMGFNRKLNLIETMCIVLYVPVKGIIPVGEKLFPENIGGISTDVREGEFVFHGQTEADQSDQNLRMGCLIETKQSEQSGTLGGFVDLPEGKTGCITAAHVVLSLLSLEKYFNSKNSDQSKFNASLGKEIIEIYHPKPGCAAFGKVVKIASAEGDALTVDAAMIEITDHNRTPNTGLFPSGNYPVNGFTKEHPMMFNSGKTHGNSNISIGSSVVKYGSTTNITEGKVVSIGASVRLLYNGALQLLCQTLGNNTAPEGG